MNDHDGTDGTGLTRLNGLNGLIDGTNRGSAWAAMDEAFFRLVQDAFTAVFCAGAGALLACNDEPPSPEQQASRQQTMRRHPSARRRF